MKSIVILVNTLYNQNAFALYLFRPIRWKQYTSPKTSATQSIARKNPQTLTKNHRESQQSVIEDVFKLITN